MKKLFLSFVIIASSFMPTFAQDDCEIHLMTIIPDEDDKTPDAANEYLYNRLCTAISQDGISATGNYAQFFVSSRAEVINEDVVPGPPLKTSLLLSLNLYIGDFMGEKVFTRTSFEVKGVGTSRERAYMNAYRMLTKQNSKIVKFVSEGKQRIMSYYDSEYPKIITEAKREAKLRNYDHALYMLYAVPTCSKGYRTVTEELLKIYQEYIDYNGEMLLNKAKNVWALCPDQNGAADAAVFMEQIDPNSKSYKGCNDLYKEIKSKVKDDWTFEMRKKYEDKLDITKQMIEGARQVGVAYGNGQQPVTTNLMWMH